MNKVLTTNRISLSSKLSLASIVSSIFLIASSQAAHAVAAPATGAKPAAAAGKPAAGGKTFSGNASWYGQPFHGRKTASGEIFDMNKNTCAHLKLPFQTKVLVEDPKTGKTVVVRVTDRGPYAKNRIMDLARGAAVKLGTISHGVSFVQCTLVSDDD